MMVHYDRLQWKNMMRDYNEILRWEDKMGDYDGGYDGIILCEIKTGYWKKWKSC